MGNLREIKSRIKTVGNTAKITRTMELIATAKAQVCVKRIKTALPYFNALADIASQARRAGADDADGGHPLLEEREVKRVAILIVVANRGFCGGYNGNCMRMARDRRQALLDEGKEVDLYISGKKGISWLKFQHLAWIGDGYTAFEDKPAYADVEGVADTLITSFMSGGVDRVEVTYTHYLSAGRQVATTETLLPITQPVEDKVEGKADEARSKDGANVDFIIEPDPASILDTLFPLQAKLHLYRVYLEAATSEQLARQIAMKNATENASEMRQTLKMAYNRARQTQITNEILEVIGGAEALA
jgi:F-type H+-transporting ATPase subunit gamma